MTPCKTISFSIAQSKLSRHEFRNKCTSVLNCILIISSLFSAPVLCAQFTIEHGLMDSVHIHTGTEYGSGVSFYDFDNDGWDDLTFGSGTGPIHFYKNNMGTLTAIDLGIENSPEGYVTALLWADYDNDGDEDLLLIKKGAPPQLWQNDGNFNFTNVAPLIGIEQGYHDYYGAAFCDYDHDGCLDLYISKFNSGSVLGIEQNSKLYRSNCNGTFEDVTQSSGVAIPPRPVFQPVFADLNEDGWEDLYLIIDKVDFQNEYFINNQDGTFTNVSSESGAGVNASAMTGTIGDYDNDGDLDIFVSNDPVPHNILLQNTGDGLFTDVASEMGLVEPPIYPGWGGLWIDYNNNSWQDLFNGTVTSQFSPPSGNRFYINQEGTGFINGSDIVGIQEEMTETFVCAKGDINNDGYPDFFTNNPIPLPSVFYLNEGGENNYLAVQLQGTYSNKNGIGSWIHCYANGQHYVRFTSCGENFKGQDSGREIFGLGEQSKVDSLLVEWNRGTRDVLYDVAINQTVVVVEGSTQSQPFALAPNDTLYLCENDTILLNANQHLTYLWNTGSEEQEIWVTEPGLYWVEVTNIYGFEVTSTPLTILQAEEPEINWLADDVSCFGLNDGSIWLDISTSPLQSIEWHTGQTLPFIDQLSPGEYIFSAIDAYGCHYTDSIAITEPDTLSGEVFSTDVLCHGTNSGTADLTISGGTPPYNIEWSNNQIGSLEAGEYTVTLTDWNTCIWEDVFIIEQPDSLNVDLTFSHYNGSDDPGSAALEITGGTPPYFISWSTGVLDTLNLIDLQPGSYSVSITDSNDCEVFESFVIDQLSSTHNVTVLARFYPNPAQALLHVELESTAPAQIILFDYVGRKVSEFHVTGQYSTIDLTDITAGVYELCIFQHDRMSVEKIIIAK